MSAAPTTPSVVMLGSANRDLVFRVDRAPGAGETVLAHDLARYAGGKGLNQGVAAARAGASVAVIAAVGRDDDGAALSTVMTDDGMDVSGLRLVDEPTGTALIVVDGAGENSIIVASGANAALVGLTTTDTAALAAAPVLLMQLEVPMPIVLAAAQAAGGAVILNAAPAQPLADDLLAEVTHLIVNEHEARIIASLDDLDAACRALAERVPVLVVTLGAAGCALFDGGVEIGRVPGRRVEVVDTTGAGDTFCGAFAARIADGDTPIVAADFATVAASLSVQRRGAVPSIPRRAAVEAAR